MAEIEEVQQDEQVVESTPPATPEWRAGLPEDVRDLESLTKFDKAENPFQALVNGFIGAERAIGADKVVLPGKEATEEEQRQFYTRIGCPESIDGYAPPTENISPQFDADLFNDMREDAHRMGLTPQQFAGVARAFDARQTAHAERLTTDRANRDEKWDAEIRQKYGDAYDQNTTLARSVVSEFGGDEMFDLLESAGLSNHPLVVDFCAKVGRTMAEDEILGGGGAQTFVNTPDSARSEWQALTLDKEFVKALQDNNDPGHKAAVEKQTKLFQQMHPGE